MWLKSFRINDKALTDVELAVLSNIPDEKFVKATELIDKLDRKLHYWTPERGTIYPLLHRLTAQDLLVKADGSSLRFRRTPSATTFLSSLLSSDQLFAQFDTTTRYLELLAESMIEVDPFAAQEFINNFISRIGEMKSKFSKFKEQAESLVDDEGWTEIDVQ